MTVNHRFFLAYDKHRESSGSSSSSHGVKRRK